jgi:carboxymethylenebutenolidase
MSGAYAVAQNPRGAVLVVHENRGLTDHIRAVTGRLAGDGYSALAPRPCSPARAATAAAKDATAALGGISEADLVADLRSGLRRAGPPRFRREPSASSGFCFGGGMVWQLLNSGPDRSRRRGAVLRPAPADAQVHRGQGRPCSAIFAQQDDRVNAGRDTSNRALTAAGVTHEFVTEPDAGHAFFNDTAPATPAAATDAYRRLLDWFGAHLG